MAGDSTMFGPPSPGAGIDRAGLMERIRIATEQAQAAADSASYPMASSSGLRSDVFYDDQGRRDPFEPLLKGLRSGFISDALPSVETLRMVGVLRDADVTMALLEDTDGHSYIMRPGNQVANGRIVSVSDSRVICQVDEYGWTRTVVLQLTSQGADPSKALGMNTQPAPEETAPAKQGE